MEKGRDYIGVSAGAVITNDKEQFFLARRGMGARDDHDCWEFPGGTVQFYETREEAAIRNIQEKYSVDIKIHELLNVYDVIDTQNKDHWLSTTYLCSYVSGVPKIRDVSKCTDIGWFSLAELQTLKLSRITTLNLNDLLRR